MKKALRLLAFCCAFGLVAGSLSAHEGHTHDQHEHDKAPEKKKPALLTKEQRAKIEAAHEAARKDPEVIKAFERRQASLKAMQEAGRQHRELVKAHFESMRAAMLKADPSIAELLPENGEGLKGWMRDRGSKGVKPGKGAPESSKKEANEDEDAQK